MKRGSGIKGRDDRSSGIEIRIDDALANINPTGPFILALKMFVEAFFLFFKVAPGCFRRTVSSERDYRKRRNLKAACWALSVCAVSVIGVSIFEGKKGTSQEPVHRLVELGSRAAAEEGSWRAKEPKGQLEMIGELMAHSHDPLAPPTRLRICAAVRRR
jgi:hypothetical protein